MTIDEAIKHAEEVAEEQEKLYRLCPASESIFHCDGTKDCKTLKNGKNKGCQKCAAEHRQLAEWLKNYKRLLEQKPCEDAISREAVMHILDEIGGDFDSTREAVVPIDYIADMVSELPSVSQQPKIGKWIYRKEEDSYRCNLCTFPCHKDNMGAIPTMYCAGCGAYMQEVENG